MRDWGGKNEDSWETQRPKNEITIGFFFI